MAEQEKYLKVTPDRLEWSEARVRDFLAFLANEHPHTMTPGTLGLALDAFVYKARIDLADRLLNAAERVSQTSEFHREVKALLEEACNAVAAQAKAARAQGR